MPQSIVFSDYQVTPARNMPWGKVTNTTIGMQQFSASQFVFLRGGRFEWLTTVYSWLHKSSVPVPGTWTMGTDGTITFTGFEVNAKGTSPFADRISMSGTWSSGGVLTVTFEFWTLDSAQSLSGPPPYVVRAEKGALSAWIPRP